MYMLSEYLCAGNIHTANLVSEKGLLKGAILIKDNQKQCQDVVGILLAKSYVSGKVVTTLGYMYM